MKLCGRCRQRKQPDDFYAYYADGRLVVRSRCMVCVREQQRARYWRDPEPARARARARKARIR